MKRNEGPKSQNEKNKAGQAMSRLVRPWGGTAGGTGGRDKKAGQDVPP